MGYAVKRCWLETPSAFSRMLIPMRGSWLERIRNFETQGDAIVGISSPPQELATIVGGVRGDQC